MKENIKNKSECNLTVTKDHRVLLNGAEIKRCRKISIDLEAGSDPEVMLWFSVYEICIDDYMDCWLHKGNN